MEQKPSASMDYQSALILAMKQEKAAFRLYTDLAASTDDEKTRDLFLSLAQEEAKTSSASRSSTTTTSSGRTEPPGFTPEQYDESSRRQCIALVWIPAAQFCPRKSSSYSTSKRSLCFASSWARLRNRSRVFSSSVLAARSV